MDPFFEQLKQNILALVSSGKAKDAYSRAKQLLAQYPDDEDVRRIYREVAEVIGDENERLVEKALPALEASFDTGDYAKVLSEAGRLLKFAPKHGDLKDLFFKAQRAYAEKLEHSVDLMEARHRQRFEELLANSPESLNEELFSLDMANPNNDVLHKLTSEFRDRLIEKLIKEKEELIYSDKFEAFEHFLSELRRIDPKSKRVMDLERLMKAGQGEMMQEDRLEFLYRGQQHLKTLLRLKKFDKAMKVAEEILVADPKASYAKRGLSEAKRKLYGESRAAAVDLVIAEREALKKSFQAEPQSFLRV